MNPTQSEAPGSVNLWLVLATGIMIGVIAGVFVGQQGPMVAATHTNAGPCPNELDPADAYIIAGFVCPAPACQDQMSECHCDEAHKIKDQIKQELGQGKEGSVIRQELQQQYGARLKPIGG